MMPNDLLSVSTQHDAAPRIIKQQLDEREGPVYPCPEDFYLLDSQSQDASLVSLYRHSSDPDFIALFAGTDYQELMDLSPLLVPARQEDALQASLHEEWRHGRALKLAVGAESSKEQLVGHLRSLFSVSLAKGGSAYLRYYDSRLLLDLLEGFGPGELAAFLGPITRFEGCMAEEHWCLDNSQPLRLPVQANGWFVLSERVQKHLAQRRRQRFIALLADQCDRPSALIEQWIKQGTASGFSSERVLQRFCQKLADGDWHQPLPPTLLQNLTARDGNEEARLEYLQQQITQLEPQGHELSTAV